VTMCKIAFIAGVSSTSLLVALGGNQAGIVLLLTLIARINKPTG
jgi:hypothetical protein